MKSFLFHLIDWIHFLSATILNNLVLTVPARLLSVDKELLKEKLVRYVKRPRFKCQYWSGWTSPPCYLVLYAWQIILKTEVKGMGEVGSRWTFIDLWWLLSSISVSRPFSYSWWWTCSSLQWRLMRTVEYH